MITWSPAPHSKPHRIWLLGHEDGRLCASIIQEGDGTLLLRKPSGAVLGRLPAGSWKEAKAMFGEEHPQQELFG